ncbi:epoxide hydrolase family protein [Glacieibacterium frigidum]|uniref:Epoxide hydrolase n=1 Tax=Glacieibacterium frigidum TaxID=2593303 RepID=A0A552U8E0_9SPHN|nr:epoxide hydrolase family protein [Glacieibacterium frigidum]TRW14485.1 epoxide hydrolase [Glacieibacterium frigidum]
MKPIFARADASDDPPSRRHQLLSRRAILGAAAASAAIPIFADAVHAAQQSPLRAQNEVIAPFRISIPQEELDGLRSRLRLTRWPETETVRDWSQGVPLIKAKALIDAWSRHDWRAFERRVNQLPQFLTSIDGLDIHFIHVRSRHPGALPILLTHGWPGSFAEFLDCIGPLTDPVRHGGRPEDAFDVVIPSLPGYGFSGKPTAPGWNVDRTASAWGKLMKRLGYTRWVAQGGDWGASVTTTLGKMRPEGLIGIHLNWAFVFPESIPADLDTVPPGLSAEEMRAVEQARVFRTQGIGYFKEMSTKPQTMGYGLLDSPVALATFIYEKFQTWSDNEGDPEQALTMTAMLDDISLYWFTRSGASAGRFYWENPGNSFAGPRIELPVAVSVFPREIYQVPRSWAEQTFPKLIHFNELDRGGHFAAMEQPSLFTAELRKAFATLRR